MNKSKLLKITIIFVLLPLIPLSFKMGMIIGEFKNSKPALNKCIEASKIPMQNYKKIPVDRFADMYKLFYGDKYSYDQIIIPSNISFQKYYNNLKPTGFEYFLTQDGKIIQCGMYK